jgi:hypothetical protein
MESIKSEAFPMPGRVGGHCSTVWLNEMNKLALCTRMNVCRASTLAASRQGDRMSLRKNRPKFCPTHFLSKPAHKLFRRQSGPTILSYFGNFYKAAQRKQPPNRPKFAQYGHPVFGQCMYVADPAWHHAPLISHHRIMYIHNVHKCVPNNKSVDFV